MDCEFCTNAAQYSCGNCGRAICSSHRSYRGGFVYCPMNTNTEQCSPKVVAKVAVEKKAAVAAAATVVIPKKSTATKKRTVK